MRLVFDGEWHYTRNGIWKEPGYMAAKTHNQGRTSHEQLYSLGFRCVVGKSHLTPTREA